MQLGKLIQQFLNDPGCIRKNQYLPITNLLSSGACKSKGITLKPEIFPAGTDSRYLRTMGIPAYGLSPINNTPILLHDHNEWLGVDTFLKGIEILQEVIIRCSNV